MKSPPHVVPDRTQRSGSPVWPGSDRGACRTARPAASEAPVPARRAPPASTNAPATGASRRTTITIDAEHDLAGEPFPGDGAHAAPRIAGVPAVAHAAVHVTEDPARQRGVEELGAVAGGHRRPQVRPRRRAPSRRGASATRTRRSTEPREPRRARASTGRASGRPSTNGPVPVRHSTAPRIVGAGGDAQGPPRTSRSSRHLQQDARPPGRRSPTSRPARPDVAPAASRRSRRRSGSHSQRRSASASAVVVTGRQEQPGSSPVGSRAERLWDSAHARGQHRQCARQRLGDDHAVGLAAAGEHEQRRHAAYDASSSRPVRGPVSTNRSARPAVRMPRAQSSTKSGAGVSAPTHEHRQPRSAIAGQRRQQHVVALAGRHRADAQEVAARVAAYRRRRRDRRRDGRRGPERGPGRTPRATDRRDQPLVVTTAAAEPRTAPSRSQRAVVGRPGSRSACAAGPPAAAAARRARAPPGPPRRPGRRPAPGIRRASPRAPPPAPGVPPPPPRASHRPRARMRTDQPSAARCSQSRRS